MIVTPKMDNFLPKMGAFEKYLRRGGFYSLCLSNIPTNPNLQRRQKLKSCRCNKRQ